MATGSFDSGWFWFYTNPADPGGPAQHDARFYGTYSTQVIGSVTRLTLRATTGMRIYGNGAGSGYFEAGQWMQASDGWTSNLQSTTNYQWAFMLAARDNAGHNVSSGWGRATHDYGEYAPGEMGYTYTLDYTKGGRYTVTLVNDIIDSPNHSHQAASSSFSFEIEIEDPDYRPGQHKVSNIWQSHNRGSGRCNRKVNGAWVEMRTQGGDDNETGNPPSRKRSGTWYNQKKLGTGA